MVNDVDRTPYQRGLLIFVVDEPPTGGIDRKEFTNSLAWTERLGGLSAGRTLKILGPSFYFLWFTTHRSIQRSTSTN
jgi:hypothetical protein